MSAPIPPNSPPKQLSASGSSVAFVQQQAEMGVLTTQEFFYRLGLLICAVVFLLEAVALNLQAGILLFGLWLCNALVLLMLTLGWKVLGDWRQPLNQALLGLASLVIPLYSYALFVPSPKKEENLAVITQAFANARGILEAIPGGMFLGATLQLFFFFIVLLIILIITTAESEWFQRSSVALLFVVQSLSLLLIYQNIELILSLFFLCFFLKTIWHKPLIIPEQLDAHINPLQRNYLRQLLKEGSLSTGQTKVYLQQQATLFAELLDHQLVEVDSFAREIFPGKRMNNHTAVRVYLDARKLLRRAIWIVMGLLYFILPDIIPITFLDDIIVLIITMGIGIDWKAMFQKKREGRPN